MRFFSRFLTGGQPLKADLAQQHAAEAEGRRLIDLGFQYLQAMETEQRLASFAARKQGEQDHALLAQWHESRTEVDRIYAEYAAAFERYRVAALSAGPGATRNASHASGFWRHASTI